MEPSSTFAALLAYWTHDLDGEIFHIYGDFALRWYGLAYVAGFVVAMWLLSIYYKRGRSPLGPEAQGDLMIGIVIGVLVGGRLGYVVFYRPDMLSDPLAILNVSQGGMASHGGFIGVILALVWFAWKLKMSLFKLGDLVATLPAAGLFFGRVANFINGELWGKPTDVPWAVIFPDQEALIYGESVPRHPSQLYEAIGEGLILFAYIQWRFWKSPVTRKHPGHLAGEFLVIYAIARIFCEQFREPDTGISLILGMNRGMFYSIFMIAAGASLIVHSRLKARRLAKAQRPSKIHPE